MKVELKAQALARERWREGSDGYLEKGPFPKEKTLVNVVVQSRDEQSEETVLSLTPKNAGQNPRVHYSLDPNFSENYPVVEDLESFRTKEPTLYSLAGDPSGEHETEESKQWKAKLKIRHQVLDEPEQHKIELI